MLIASFEGRKRRRFAYGLTHRSNQYVRQNHDADPTRQHTHTHKKKQSDNRATSNIDAHATDMWNATRTSIVIVTVHMEDLLALLGEDTRKNAFLQPSAHAQPHMSIGARFEGVDVKDSNGYRREYVQRTVPSGQCPESRHHTLHPVGTHDTGT